MCTLCSCLKGAGEGVARAWNGGTEVDATPGPMEAGRRAVRALLSMLRGCGVGARGQREESGRALLRVSPLPFAPFWPSLLGVPLGLERQGRRRRSRTMAVRVRLESESDLVLWKRCSVASLGWLAELRCCTQLLVLFARVRLGQCANACVHHIASCTTRVLRSSEPAELAPVDPNGRHPLAFASPRSGASIVSKASAGPGMQPIKCITAASAGPDMLVC